MPKKVNRKSSLKEVTTKSVSPLRQQTPGVQQVRPAASEHSPAAATPALSPSGPSLPLLTASEIEALNQPVTLPALPPVVHITFTTYEPHAEQVTLAGEFNNWSPDSLPLKRQTDGHWQAILTLPPGRYQYKFIVDGQWMPDLNAHEHVFNPYGTLNSVIAVRTTGPR